MRHWILTLACFVAACSGEDEPPIVTPRDGGNNAGEGSSSGGSTANGGTGPTGGTGNTGAFGNPDPEEVYVLGTLGLGRTDVPALFHWSSRDEYAAGFQPTVNVFKAKVGESGLFYQLQNVNEVRRFVPDLTSSEPLESVSYPEDPTGNDPVVAELDCTMGGFVLHFVVGPADRIVYFCSSVGWFEDGELIYEGLESMLALGNGDLAVITDDSTGAHYVVNLASAEKFPLADIGTIYAARATRNGFLIAGIGIDGDELWEVDGDGDASSRGLYSEREPGIFRYFWALDPEGDLFELDQVGSPETNLTRRTVGGSDELISSDLEAANAYVAGQGLATGP